MGLVASFSWARVALLASVALDGRSVVLNTLPDLVPSADVLRVESSADEQWIVYLVNEGDLEGDRAAGLYSRPSDGSSAARRLADVADPRTGTDELQISPDGTHVVYLAGEFAPYRLFGVPIDGSGPALELAGPHVTRFRVTLDSTRVLFRADLYVDDRFLLWSVPIGGGAPLEENATMAGGRDVEEFVLTPDGTRVVYRADGHNQNNLELYCAPLGPVGGAIRLNPTQVRQVQPTFHVTPDSQRVVFLSNLLTSSRNDLFSIPLDGSGAWVRLNDPGFGSGDIAGDFRLTPDGTHVVYASDSSLGARQLYSARVDGIGPTLVLTPGLPAGHDVSLGLALDPLGARVVYRADALTNGVTELFSAPIDASAAPVRLSPPLAPGLAVLPEFRIAPAGGHVAFVTGASSFAGVPGALFSAPLDGGAPALALDPEATSVKRDLAFGPNGLRLFYLKAGGSRTQLWSVRADGSTLAAPFSSGLAAADFRVVASGAAVLYAADEDQPGVVEAFVRNTSGITPPVQVSAEFPADARTGTVAAVQVAGAHAVYAANPDGSPFFSLYAVPVAGHRAPVCISDGGAPLDVQATSATLAIGAGGTRAVFLGYRGEQLELFAAPLDGSAPPVRLSGPLADGGHVASFALTPDRTRVLYLADAEVDGAFELFRAGLDGGSPPVRLNGPLVTGGDVVRFHASADGARVLYVADQDTDERLELYAADGLGPPVKLNAPLIALGDVGLDPWLTPDGNWAFFRADASVDARFELFRAPADGSAGPIALSGPMPSGASVREGFLVTPDGARVAFTANLVPGLGIDLYGAPADGAVPPYLLSADGDDTSFARALQLDPSGTRVVYGYSRAGEATKVFAVPVDGSASQTLLSPLATDLDVALLPASPPPIQVGAGGTHVVYRVGSGTAAQLWASRLDGSGAPVRLDAPGISAGQPLAHLVAPDGERVAYLAVLPFSARAQVFDVPIDRRHEPVRLHGALPGASVGAQPDPVFAAGGSTLLFRLDLDRPGSLDLHAAWLERGPRPRTLTGD